MKYRIYFGDLTHTGLGTNSKAFPLGVGLVMANALKELDDLIECELFKFPEDLNQAILDNPPDLLCLSNYCWNINLSHKFASYLKKISPDSITVFGGPNFPVDLEERKDFLTEYPDIDFYIKWDGEVAFVNLMRNLIDWNLNIEDFKKNKTITENCCYLFKDEYIEGPDHRIRDLKTLPSPYLMGIFDKFFPLDLHPLIETTRGCPYACTFCNDGHHTRNAVTRQSHDFIKKELEYIAPKVKQHSPLVMADLNFGMYKEDIVTSKIIAEVIEKYNWPNKLEVSMGKSQPVRMVETVTKINEAKPGTLRYMASLQSTDEKILKLIKRKNMPFDQMVEMERQKKTDQTQKTEYFTEFILALPGDDLEKHYKSLETAIDLINMDNIDVHQLILLKGTEMATRQEREKFPFDVRYRVYIGCFGLYGIGDEKEVPVAEIEETVVGHETLSFKDYLECRIVNLLVKIYIDHDPFREVFGFIRSRRLSVFGLLLHLRKIFPKYDSLSDLLASFIEGTKKPLIRDTNSLKDFLNKENIKKYRSGELGGNEMLNHRAMAHLHYSKDLHAVLRESSLSYLKEHNLLTNENLNYIIQSIRFSELRNFDLKNLHSQQIAEFNYGFIKADELGHTIDPRELKVDKMKIKFYHDQNVLKILK